MKPYFVKTPGLIPLLFWKQTWRILSEKKTIYLTFDDGPTAEITKWILDTLQQYHAKATFFCIGKNIEAHPDLFKRISEDGHAIGNHTFDHLNGWKTANKDYLDSVLKTEKIMLNLNPHASSPLFRPPYGKIKNSQTRSLMAHNFTIIMWSVLSADFDASINADRCLKNVIKNTEDGSIVVFHDSVKAFDKLKLVLPKVLQHFSKKGFVFKRIKLS